MKPIWASSKDAEAIVRELLERLANRSEAQFKRDMEGVFPIAPWEPFVFIVAKEFAHANYIARFHRIPKKQWKYVWEMNDIGGGTGKVCFYYRWYELRQGDQIRDYVLTFPSRFEIIELSDTVIGVDHGSKPDVTVISAPCGNCGTYRTIKNGIMQKCTYCGDDETDLNEEIQIP